jgi:hypothetical protein
MQRKDLDLEQLNAIFPNVEKSVAEAIYEHNGFSLELTVNDLMKMMETTNVSYETSLSRDVEVKDSSLSRDVEAKDSSLFRDVTGHSDTSALDNHNHVVYPPEIEEQLKADEAFALELQKREAADHELTRDVPATLGTDPGGNEIKYKLTAFQHFSFRNRRRIQICCRPHEKGY